MSRLSVLEKFPHVLVLCKRLLFALALFEITRLLFFISNYSQFGQIKFTEAVSVFFFGLRFDFAVIFYTNLLFILLHLIPFNGRDKKGFQLMLKVLFVVVISITLFPCCADIEYYKYLNKRSTADVFDLLKMGNDVGSLLPQYVKDFWYVFIIWFGLIFASIKFYPSLRAGKNNLKIINESRFSFFRELIIFVLVVGIFFSVARGFALKPLRIISALEYTKPEFAPLILNSAFTIINTLSVEQIEEKKYFEEKELSKYFNPENTFHGDTTKKHKNVVIIILESFSKEYIGSLNKSRGHTPFLDSLIKQGFFCSNAFANGKRSISAMPAVFSGLPSLMNEPFISSNYSTNKINSLALTLKDAGYESSFFHGGSNGTMGFDVYAASAGFGKYYGRTEYGNEKDFDGNWGIFDEPFLQFAAEKIDEMKQPFLAGIFTLSSHHPYSVPDKYKDLFKGGDHPILKSIEYADYSLKKFFQKASKSSWYNNTLFVLVSDHTAPVKGEFYNNKVGVFAIPVLYFNPGDTLLKGVCKTVTQQADIYPSVIDYLNISGKFACFGNSVFSISSKHFALNFLDDYFLYLSDSTALFFDGDKSLSMYNFNSDSLLQKNILPDFPKQASEYEQRLKAIIQSYNSRMLRNKLYY